MAKVVRFHRVGGPEVLQLEEMEFGAPAAGELRIRVSAIGINRMELVYRSGGMGQPEQMPAVLGSEGAGTVEGIGAGVTGFAIGDRVATIPGFTTVPGFKSAPGGHVCAVYGEQAFVPANMAVKIPDRLSFVQGAALWMQYATVYSALICTADVQKGDVVVMTAASSAVGIAAIQVVNALGAVSIATTRTPSKAEALRKLGAQHVIVTNQQDVATEVMRITHGKGARVIFDPVAGEGMARLLAAAAYGGILLIYGALAPTATTIDIAGAMGKGITLRFPTQFEVSLNPELRQKLITFVLEGVSNGTLQPVIDRTFGLHEIVAAHRYVEGNRHTGKVVVKVD